MKKLENLVIFKIIIYKKSIAEKDDKVNLKDPNHLEMINGIHKLFQQANPA